MSVRALLIPMSGDPVACTVRPWLKSDEHMVGSLPGTPGVAERAEAEDQIRFDLSEFQPSELPRKLMIVSVEAGEAYRLQLLYPADLGWQTARVTRLSAEEAAGLPVPEADDA